MTKSKKIREVLNEPKRFPLLSIHAKWLSGEGAGSWFDFFEMNDSKNILEICRYSSEGELECRGIYVCEELKLFSLETQFEINYPSNCNEVILNQAGIIFIFHFIQLC